ncbi:hypothetical protein MKEN_01242900 [Mycena kentingensis (nom. inval.)]|nr:hypothetical protein MKEN_01242900 [Mycena kentingensis (nom. inval.)]
MDASEYLRAHLQLSLDTPTRVMTSPRRPILRQKCKSTRKISRRMRQRTFNSAPLILRSTRMFRRLPLPPNSAESFSNYRSRKAFSSIGWRLQLPDQQLLAQSARTAPKFAQQPVQEASSSIKRSTYTSMAGTESSRQYANVAKHSHDVMFSSRIQNLITKGITRDVPALHRNVNINSDRIDEVRLSHATSTAGGRLLPSQIVVVDDKTHVRAKVFDDHQYQWNLWDQIQHYQGRILQYPDPSRSLEKQMGPRPAGMDLRPFCRKFRDALRNRGCILPDEREAPSNLKELISWLNTRRAVHIAGLPEVSQTGVIVHRLQSAYDDIEPTPLSDDLLDAVWIAGETGQPVDVKRLHSNGVFRVDTFRTEAPSQDYVLSSVTEWGL